MARLKDENKRAAIHNAVVAEDLHSGLAGALDNKALAETKALLVALLLHVARQAAILKPDIDQASMETTFANILEALRGRS